MSISEVRRVQFFVIFVVFSTSLADDYVVPPVRIQAFRPRGVRISIPDVPGITLFAFNGNINKGIRAAEEHGTIKAEVKQPTNGRWMFENPTVQLNVGDVIYYYVLVETGLIEGTRFLSGHYTGTLRQRIERLEDISPGSNTDTVEVCQPSLTEVYEGTAKICSGQILLEDRFFSLKENVWQIEHYIPIDNPEYPFLSYQRSSVTMGRQSQLAIQARLQQNDPGFINDTINCGSLDLIVGCTKPLCSLTASGADVVPPVASGRLTSKGFAFKYGIVMVRAKLPVGDWLYPEILLEPMVNIYGSMHYASGVIKIAAARGNQNLVAGNKDYSNKVLYGGPIMSYECREQLLQEFIHTDNNAWSDDFHIYSLRWTPDYISLFVDGKEWANIDTIKNTLRGKFARSCNVKIPANSTKMAPFDDFFRITLGLSVGGVTEFRDDVKTKDDYPKPWKNDSPKAMLNFWRDMHSWNPTWKRPKMLVDFVRVIAL